MRVRPFVSTATKVVCLDFDRNILVGEEVMGLGAIPNETK